MLKAKLAACGNIIPGITSVYEWQGAVETETEVSLLLKTMATKQEALTAFEHHPSIIRTIRRALSTCQLKVAILPF